jgi:AraC family transcriptional regulator, arabinose operon regulatory protein
MEQILSELRIGIQTRSLTECAAWWNHDDVSNPIARLYQVLEGEGFVEHHGRSFHLVPGQLFLIPASTRLNMHCHGRMLKRWTHFTAELPNGFDLFMAMEPAFELKLADCPAWTAGVLDRFWELNMVNGAIAMLESEAILRLLIALFLQAGPGGGEDTMSALTKFKPVLALIESRLAAKITLGELAKTVSLHPVYFSNEFARRMGVPPMEYVRQRRIERAKHLLVGSRRKLPEIAALTGFADGFHLSRTFKRLVGQTPSDYRARALRLTT